METQFITLNNRIQDWCAANYLSLNQSKTCDFKLTLSKTSYSTDECVKFLGINLEPGLGWSAHVEHISNKISKGLFILRILRNSISTDTLIAVYYAYVHSHLSYGTLLWGNHGSCKKLFILQKRAVRIICGALARDHCRPYFVEHGILTLPSIYVLACLMYVRNNINKFSICSQIHGYPTRNNSNIYIDKCKYTVTQNSFEIVSVNLFNSLPDNIRNLPIQTFRRVVRARLRANPLYAVDEFYQFKDWH